MSDDDIAQNLLLLVSSEDRTCSMWNLTTGLREITYSIHPMRITDCVAMVPANYNFFATKNADYEDVTGKFNRGTYRSRKSRKERRKAQDWDEYSKDEMDDMYFLHKFAIIITTCADGKVRMFNVDSGDLLRTFINPRYARGGEYEGREPPGAFCVDVFVPRTVRQSVEKLEEKSDESAKRSRQSSRTQSGSLSRDRTATIDTFYHNFMAFGEILTENVSEGFGNFGQVAQNASNFPAKDRTFRNKERNMKVDPEGDPRILIGYEDGVVLSFDIATGCHFRTYEIASASQGESTITCVINDQLTEAEKARLEDFEGGNENDALSATNDCALPTLFASALNRKLWRQKASSRFEEARSAYETDKVLRVPREWSEKVPIAFQAWPRVYLLAQHFGGLRPFLRHRTSFYSQ